MPERILIVEDEPSISAGLKLNLEAEGFAATVVDHGLRAIEKIRVENFDLVLLDVMLPGASGFDVCERVRAEGNRVPIIFLTARDAADARIQGLEIGGDDYITKPFSLRELIQRVRAVLRRQQWYQAAPASGHSYRFAEFAVDFSSYAATTRQGAVALTQKECMLFKLLVEREGRVVTREEILDAVWGYDRYPSTRTIDNLVLRLRKYFEADPKRPRHLHSVYAAGYKFTKEPVDE